MHKMLPLAAALSVGTIGVIEPAGAGTRTFGGFACKRSCAPFAKGYRWAEHAHVTDPIRCQVTNSKGFRAGCMVYTQAPNRGADLDDDGHPI